MATLRDLSTWLPALDAQLRSAPRGVDVVEFRGSIGPDGASGTLLMDGKTKQHGALINNNPNGDDTGRSSSPYSASSTHGRSGARAHDWNSASIASSIASATCSTGSAERHRPTRRKLNGEGMFDPACSYGAGASGGAGGAGAGSGMCPGSSGGMVSARTS